MTYTTSLDKIEDLTAMLSTTLRGGEVLALIGPLGSGKTTFTQALGRHLKICNRITSPTFIIMQVFKGRLKKKPIQFYHLDLYRTKNFKEIIALGIEEFWQNRDNITVIEWADKIKNNLPKDTIYIYFKNLGQYNA